MNDILRNAFYEEAEELFGEIEKSLLAIEGQGANKEKIDSLFRYMHTLKGSSAAMELSDMAQITHKLEDTLGLIRDDKLNFTPEFVSIMFQSLDEFKIRVQKHKQNESYQIDVDKYIISSNDISTFPIINKKDVKITEEEKINIMNNLVAEEIAYNIEFTLKEDCSLKGARLFVLLTTIETMGKVYKTSWQHLDIDSIQGNFFTLIFITQLSQKEIEDLVYTVLEIEEVKVSPVHMSLDNSGIDVNPGSQVQSVIRVNIEKLDKLLRIVEEISVDKERLKQLSNMINRDYPKDNKITALNTLVQHIDYTCNEMQESVMSIRMYTLENVFQRFPRLVRDLALKQGKEIELKIEGESTELDRSIIEKIIDPLTHIVRNSVDHGIEMPNERVKANKKSKGFIKLTAGQQDSHVFIRIEDDGRGINLSKLKESALHKGLLTEGGLKNISEKEILDILFMPGFSTAEKITDVSGRGVGMNVVKENIEKINGIIDIDNKEGKGLIITLKLPLTLAIIQSLLIKSGQYCFALPLPSIIEIFRIKEDEYDNIIKLINGYEVINWRGEVLSILRISDLYNADAAYKSKKFIGIVVGFSHKKSIIGVEEIIGEQQIVIKSMDKFTGRGNILGDLMEISGTAILGDGDFAYVLDIQSMMREMLKKRNQFS